MNSLLIPGTGRYLMLFNFSIFLLRCFIDDDREKRCPLIEHFRNIALIEFGVQCQCMILITPLTYQTVGTWSEESEVIHETHTQHICRNLFSHIIHETPSEYNTRVHKIIISMVLIPNQNNCLLFLSLFLSFVFSWRFSMYVLHPNMSHQAVLEPLN